MRPGSIRSIRRPTAASTSTASFDAPNLVGATREVATQTLERAGLDTERAERIAQSDADLHEAVRLIEQGCAPDLLERILL